MSLSSEAPAWLAQKAAEQAASQPQPWHGLIFRAFDALRFDRFYGSMGGQTPISYVAISQYCRDVGITTEQMPMFMAFLTAVDFEYLTMQSEKQKAEENNGGGAAQNAPRSSGDGRERLPGWRFTGDG